VDSRLVRRKLTIEPKFYQTDMLGVIHNAEYFRWFEEGRFQFIQEILPLAEARALGIVLFVVENHCVYRNHAEFGDSLVLITEHRVDPVYTGRLVFRHVLMHARHKTEIAEGSCTMAAVDYHTRQPLKAIPPAVWQRYCDLR